LLLIDLVFPNVDEGRIRRSKEGRREGGEGRERRR
jgi:hypothetical protein